jgi:alcohol dehydrogenase (cytochrome c)
MSTRALFAAGGWSLLTVLAVSGAPQDTAAPTARANQRATIRAVSADDLLKSPGDDWLTYQGSFSGTHYSPLAQIDKGNVATLQRAWISDTDPAGGQPSRFGRGAAGRASTAVPAGRTGVGPGWAAAGVIASGLIVRDGVIFFTTGPNAYAVDGKTGRQIWHYVAGSSGGLSNRGLGIRGDTLYMMANGGLTAIDAATGAERWAKDIGGAVPPIAPVVVRDHVYVASGSDSGTSRSWLESRNAQTGEREWIWYAVPKQGEFGFNTWPSEEEAAGGAGTPWQAAAYDPEQNLLIFGTGNPDPIKDARARPGDNLFTDCVVALDADTGAMKWYFQATPHDSHDYDNNQTMSLATITVDGRPRRVVTWISRNGYFYTVDRTTGENIVTSKVFPNVNWAFERLRTNGTPEPIDNKLLQRGGTLVSPSSEGAVNYPAQSFSPQTGLHYTNVVNGYGVFYWTGETFLGTFRNQLRATDPATGKVAWQHDYLEPLGIHARYSSVLTTAGGLLFSGDISGNFLAFDAATGKILWHDELPDANVTGVPVTFTIAGKQYVAVPAGTKIVSYAVK